MPTYTTPGVYIDEVPATGPITGVGTSTAAFLGPALQGPVMVPTKITSWNQFKNIFGGYITSPRCFLAYGVQGFFQNGGSGSVAYIVRVGTAAQAFLDLSDRGGGTGKSLRVRALQEGTAGNLLSVQVQDAQIVTTAQALRASGTVASAANNIVTLQNAADAANFRPGDIVTIQGTTERATIDRIRAPQIFLLSNLTGNYNSGAVRIADLVPNQTSFRVAPGTGLEAASVIQINQGATKENAVVSTIGPGFVTLSQGLVNTYTMATADAPVGIQSFEFSLIIRAPSLPDEVFTNLSMDPRHSRYFSKIVNSVSVNVWLADPPSTAVPPNNRPAAMAAATVLAGGTPDNLNAISWSNYTDAIDTLTLIQDVNTVCIPDRTDPAVQQALIAHCQTLKNRFAVLDAPSSAPPYGVGSVTEQRAGLDSASGYAALYYPRLSIPDPQSTTGDTLLVPPSPFIAGIYARVDQNVGVHKAPANEIVTGALGLERPLTETDMGQLNIAGINVIRAFPNRTQPTVWGARTTAPAAEAPWRYINVRRLFIYIEESIKEGIRWAVFEPNDLGLWQKLKRTISEFLTRVWQSGALFGATADQAFYVKCDEDLNPPPVQALGQVFVEVGIAAVRPAEFVIIQIGLWDDGSKVSES